MSAASNLYNLRGDDAQASRQQSSDSGNSAAHDAASKYLDAVPGIDPAIVREEHDSKPGKRDLTNGPTRGIMDHHHVTSNSGQQVGMGQAPNAAHPIPTHHNHYIGQQYLNGPPDPRSVASAAFMHMEDPHGVDHSNGTQPHLQHAHPHGAPGPHQHVMQQQQQQQQQQQHLQTHGAVRGVPQAADPQLGYIPNERLTSTTSMGKRRVRLGWTKDETDALLDGCKRHGVGNWKKILTDPTYRFNNRTAVDLKDRFRTSFPEEYSRLYPNAKTHKMRRRAVTGPGAPQQQPQQPQQQQQHTIPTNGGPMRQEDWSNPQMQGAMPGNMIDVHRMRGPNADPTGPDALQLVKINRKERRAFTPAEDARLLEGFHKHGPAWSKIQRDPTLHFTERRSTDLRDRFRNAFPEQYAKAGYKGRSRRGGATQSDASSGSSNRNGSAGRNMTGHLEMNDTMIKEDPSAAMGAPYMHGPPHGPPQPFQFATNAMYYPPQHQGHMMYRADH